MWWIACFRSAVANQRVWTEEQADEVRQLFERFQHSAGLLLCDHSVRDDFVLFVNCVFVLSVVSWQGVGDSYCTFFEFYPVGKFGEKKIVSCCWKVFFQKYTNSDCKSAILKKVSSRIQLRSDNSLAELSSLLLVHMHCEHWATSLFDLDFLWAFSLSQS